MSNATIIDNKVLRRHTFSGDTTFSRDTTSSEGLAKIPFIQAQPTFLKLKRYITSIINIHLSPPMHLSQVIHLNQIPIKIHFPHHYQDLSSLFLIRRSRVLHIDNLKLFNF
ncbi:hypothetical protein Hanom_Chr08g00716341 [Helianthus anomalus]